MNDLEVIRDDDQSALEDITMLQRSIEETAADRARLAHEISVV